MWRPDGADYELLSASGITGSMPNQISQDYMLGVVEKGQAKITYRGEILHIKGSSFLVLHPGETFGRQGNNKHPRTLRMLLVRPAFLQAQIAQLTEQEASLPQFDQPVVLNNNIIKTFSRIHKAIELPHSQLERDSWLQEIVALLLEHCISQQTKLPQLNKESKRIKIIKAFLEERFAENVSLEELATLVNLSAYRLNRIFSQEVGIPPHAYHTQMRVWQAKKMLEKGMSIADVAIESGFYDQPHLTRHFKRMMGFTPSVVLGNLN